MVDVIDVDLLQEGGLGIVDYSNPFPAINIPVSRHLLLQSNPLIIQWDQKVLESALSFESDFNSLFFSVATYGPNHAQSPILHLQDVGVIDFPLTISASGRILKHLKGLTGEKVSPWEMAASHVSWAAVEEPKEPKLIRLSPYGTLHGSCSSIEQCRMHVPHWGSYLEMDGFPSPSKNYSSPDPDIGECCQVKVHIVSDLTLSSPIPPSVKSHRYALLLSYCIRAL